MSLKKLSIIFSVALLVFVSSVNITSAIEVSPPSSNNNEFIKTLDFLDNNMYVLIKSLSAENINTDEVNKQINFLNTLISESYKKSAQIPKEQRDIAAALNAVTSFYELAVIKAQSYLESKDSDDLISAISTFSIGYSSSINLRTIVFGAGK